MEVLDENNQYTYLMTLNHYADMADRRAQSSEYELLVTGFIKTLGVVPYKDGNQWCCLYGENLQEGIAGFGSTPFSSAEDLRNTFYEN